MQKSVQDALALATAQSPLSLEYNGKTLALGDSGDKYAIHNPPGLRLASVDAHAKYLVVGIDLDAPYPSLPILSPLIHWLQTDLTSSASPSTSSPSTTTSSPGSAASSSSLTPTSPPTVDWLLPAPAPFSSPHRYLIILYPQPQDLDLVHAGQNWTVPVSTAARMRWSLDNFVDKAGLKPVAASFFYV